MKKTFIILLILVIMATFTVSASALTVDKSGLGVSIIVNNGAELKDALENYAVESYTTHILLNSESIVCDPIEITQQYAYISFELNSGIDECTITCNDDEKSMITLNKSAKHSELYFNDYIILSHSNNDGDGGAIYVDAEYCIIKNGWFEDCSCEVDGGAICVNRDDCRIEDCFFRDCYAGDDGGAIYFCIGADDGNVDCCEFIFCSCEDDGQCVDGDNDTFVYAINPRYNDEDYADCEGTNARGSIISKGNVWILILVGVAVISLTVFIVIKRKSKKNVKE